MQFTTFSLSALFASSVLAQAMVKTHVVRVGSMTGALTFMPTTLKADKGDMVQFQFAPKNHTVTQSTFDQPCAPSSLNSNITGIYSGFIPVAADAAMTATWTIALNDTKPLWLYCSQGKHCQGGMVMVINPPAANASRTFETYKALAAKATVNLPGGAGPSGGTPANGTKPDIIGDVVPTGGSGSTPTGTVPDAAASATASPTGTLLTAPNAARGLQVGSAAGLGLGLALVFAVLL